MAPSDSSPGATREAGRNKEKHEALQSALSQLSSGYPLKILAITNGSDTGLDTLQRFGSLTLFTHSAHEPEQHPGALAAQDMGGDALDLPLAFTHGFDIVYLSGLLGQADKGRTLLRQCFRALHGKGALLIPFSSGLFTFLSRKEINRQHCTLARLKEISEHLFAVETPFLGFPFRRTHLAVLRKERTLES